MPGVNRWTIVLRGYHPPSVNEYARSTKTRMTAVPRLVKLLEPWWVKFSPDAIPPAEQKRLVLITIGYDSKANWMDHDNVPKVVKDALKKVGLIRDDNDKWCECPEPTAELTLWPQTRIELVEGQLQPLDVYGKPFTVKPAVDGTGPFVTLGGVAFVPADQVPVLCSALRRAAAEAKEAARPKGK